MVGIISMARKQLSIFGTLILQLLFLCKMACLEFAIKLPQPDLLSIQLLSYNPSDAQHKK